MSAHIRASSIRLFPWENDAVSPKLSISGSRGGGGGAPRSDFISISRPIILASTPFPVIYSALGALTSEKTF